jgi:NADH-quinone oxidoreductase subunit C
MTLAEILQRLQSYLPDVKLEHQKGELGDSWILIPVADVLRVLSFLKNNLGINYLSCLLGMDYESSFGVIYKLRSLKDKVDLIVKIMLPKENPVVATASAFFPVAEWFEREAFDMFGIQFQDHPDLRRILLPEDWVGYPLRKDYQPPTEYQGIPAERPNAHALLDKFYPKPEPTDDQSQVSA